MTSSRIVRSPQRPDELIITGRGQRGQESGIASRAPQQTQSSPPPPPPGVSELSAEVGSMSIKEKGRERPFQATSRPVPEEAPPSYESVTSTAGSERAPSVAAPDYDNMVVTARASSGCAICQHECLACQAECLCPTCKQVTAAADETDNHSCNLSAMAESTGSLTPPANVQTKECLACLKSKTTCSDCQASTPTPEDTAAYTLQGLQESSRKSPAVQALLNNLNQALDNYRRGNRGKIQVRLAKKVLVNHLYVEEISRRQINGEFVGHRQTKSIWKQVKVLGDEVDEMLHDAKVDRKSVRRGRLIL